MPGGDGGVRGRREANRLMRPCRQQGEDPAGPPKNTLPTKLPQPVQQRLQAPHAVRPINSSNFPLELNADAITPAALDLRRLKVTSQHQRDSETQSQDSARNTAGDDLVSVSYESQDALAFRAFVQALIDWKAYLEAANKSEKTGKKDAISQLVSELVSGGWGNDSATLTSICKDADYLNDRTWQREYRKKAIKYVNFKIVVLRYPPGGSTDLQLLGQQRPVETKDPSTLRVLNRSSIDFRQSDANFKSLCIKLRHLSQIRSSGWKEIFILCYQIPANVQAGQTTSRAWDLICIGELGHLTPGEKSAVHYESAEHRAPHGVPHCLAFDDQFFRDQAQFNNFHKPGSGAWDNTHGAIQATDGTWSRNTGPPNHASKPTPVFWHNAARPMQARDGSWAV